MTTSTKSKEHYKEIRGWFTEENAATLERLVRQFVTPGGRIVEIGSFEGRSSWLLGCVADELGAKVYCVDSGVGSPALKSEFQLDTLFTNLAPLSNVEVVLGESSEVAKTFEWADLIWIDGAHDENSVTRDIKCWLPKLVRFGIMCGHDFSTMFPGVITAVLKSFSTFEVEHDIWIGGAPR